MPGELFVNKPVIIQPTTPWLASGGTFVWNSRYGPFWAANKRWVVGNYWFGLGGVFGDAPFPSSICSSSNNGATWQRADQSNYPTVIANGIASDVVFDDSSGIISILGIGTINYLETQLTNRMSFVQFDCNANGGNGAWGSAISTIQIAANFKLVKRTSDFIAFSSQGGQNVTIKYAVISGGVFADSQTLIPAQVGIAYYILQAFNDPLTNVTHVLYELIKPSGGFAGNRKELWYVAFGSDNVPGTPVQITPNSAAHDDHYDLNNSNTHNSETPYSIGQGCIWQDRILVSALDNRYLHLYEGTPLSNPVWTLKTLYTEAHYSAETWQAFIIPAGNTQVQIFWHYENPVDNTSRKIKYASYNGTVLGPVLTAWDVVLNPCATDPDIANPNFGGTITTFSIGSVQGDYELVAEEYITDILNPGTHTPNVLVWLGPPLQIFCDSPPSGQVGIAYSHYMRGTYGIPPYAFTIVAGALPTGLSLLSSTGLISGTPSVAGTFSFTVLLTDNVGNVVQTVCSIVITAQIPIVLPPGTVGTPYLYVIGGGPIIGPIPPGLVKPVDTLYGIPSSPGTYFFTVGGTPYSIVISPQTFVLDCGNPPAAEIGVFYDHNLIATGGTYPFYSIVSAGRLPPGLTIEGLRIFGIPYDPDSYQFNITVTDSTGAVRTISCSIAVACPVSSRQTPAAYTEGAFPQALNLYLRNALNDLGTSPADAYGVKVTERFVINGTSPSVIIHQTPASNIPVFVLIDNILAFSPLQYSVLSLTYTFVGSYTNAHVKIIYWV